MKFNLTLPNENKNILTIQLWDKDVFSGNDFISETSLDFDEIAARAWEEDSSVKMLGESENFKERMIGRKSEKFWVQCLKRKDDGTVANAGKVLISLELIPQVKADSSKVGEGRSEPNVNPVMPGPYGRFKFSLNPFAMLTQLVGPDVKFKICCLLCCILLCLMLAFMIPFVLANGVSRLLF